MSNIKLLNKGLFEKPFMDSRIKTESVSWQEKYLGHLIGPLGLIFVVNTIAALVEKFFTQQVGQIYGTNNIEMVRIMGQRYEVIMTIAKLLAIGVGLLNGWLLQKTESRQGRMRPWYLIFGFITIIIGFTIFLFPGNTLGEAYWYYFFLLVICFNTVGSVYFYLFRDNIVSISTHNAKEKMQLQFIRKVSWTLVSGIIIGMMISMVILPLWLEKDITGYPKLMIILSICAIPLLLMEYFYTRERVVEEANKAEDNGTLSVKQQLKDLFSNKYFVIMTVLMTVSGIVDNFKGGNVQYFYIKFMMGGNENPFMFTLFQIITGTPVGIGAIAIYPLAKKFGIKNVSLAGYGIAAIGCIVGWLFPTNVPIAMAAGFLKSLGYLPNSYITATLLAYAFDSVEQKSGHRLEGLLGVAVITALQQAIYAPFAGGYESSILKLGFVDMEGIVPTASVLKFMTMAFYAFDLVFCLANVFLLPMMDVEKHLPEINAELEERQKQAALARGEEWISPEEREKLEMEKAEKEFEENRIRALKEKCEKRGLDFETENNKYLARKNKKGK